MRTGYLAKYLRLFICQTLQCRRHPAALLATLTDPSQITERTRAPSFRLLPARNWSHLDISFYSEVQSQPFLGPIPSLLETREPRSRAPQTLVRRPQYSVLSLLTPVPTDAICPLCLPLQSCIVCQ